MISELDHHIQQTLLTTICSLLMVTTAAAQQGCASLNGHEKLLLRQLYYYSLFAEAAYSERTDSVPEWSCGAGTVAYNPPQGWNNGCSREGACGHFVRSHELEGLYERGDIASDLRKKGWRINVYEPRDGGPAHILCGWQPPDAVIFFTWVEQNPIGVDEASLLTRILVPVFRIYERIPEMLDEELEVKIFEKIDEFSDMDPPYGDDAIIAIQGTDRGRLKQILTNLKDLGSNGSCAFEFMAQVVDYYQSDRNRGRFAVTGHSLGGSVAQYVAQQCGGRTASNGFESYAFNAIGLRECDGPNPSNLHSFYIDGDILTDFGEIIGRDRGGRAIQYTPPPRRRGASTDEEVWWSDAGAVKMHLLSTAKRGICNCMDGIGSLTIREQQ